jgi:hypothetical protein
MAGAVLRGVLADFEYKVEGFRATSLLLSRVPDFTGPSDEYRHPKAT